MDKILCVIFCLIFLSIAVCVLRCCPEPAIETNEVTTEPTTPVLIAEIADATYEPVPTIETTAATEPPTVSEPEPTEETTVATEPPYTSYELEMMALVIYQEAGGDAYTDETRLMVGTVVMNRVEDERFPNTIYEVLTQKRQYGLLHWTGLVWPKRANNPVEAHAVARAYECAKRILLGERLLPEDVIFQAEFVQGTEVVVYQDGFYFCR